MPQTQQNIHIAAPGFAGLNTQDSPIGIDLAFCSKADNCVIDAEGRIASRNGLEAFTLAPETTGNMDDNPVETAYEYVEADGTRNVLLAGDKDGGSTSTLWSQDTGGNLTTVTGLTATNNDWSYTSLSDQCFMAQSGESVQYTDSATVQAMTQQPSAAAGGLTNPNVIMSAFGHLFVADAPLNKSKVQWSTVTVSTGLGAAATPWTGAGSGLIDVEEYWPNGSDQIVSIVAHNNFLVVFGRRSILVYVVPDDPNGAGVGPEHMYLSDTIENIGCIARDSVVSIGTDVLFLDASGVRSLNRTIQEKSLPVGDISRNVRDDIVADVRQADFPIRAVYSQEEALYALIIPKSVAANTVTYVFDTRRPLQDGALRCTKWLAEGLRCAVRTDSGDLFFGKAGGLYKYTGGEDTSLLTGVTTPKGVSITYLTHAQDFNEPARVKFPKQADIILIGGAALALKVQWFYDFSDIPNNYNIQRTADLGGQWGVAQWGAGQWGDGAGLISTEVINMWGSGKNIQIGFTGTIDELPVSIQEINIQSTLGRIL